MTWLETINPEPPPSPRNIILPNEGKNYDNNSQNKQTVESRIEFQQQLLKMSYDHDHNYWYEQFNALLTTEMKECDKFEQKKKRKRRT